MTFLKRILLVDHEPQVTELVRRALEATGRYLIKVEPDSSLALLSARWFLPDLILLDAAKAETEGPEVNQKLQAEASLKNTPFLFLSGGSSAKNILSGGFVSGFSFSASAVGVDEVVRCVDEMLGTRQPVRLKGRSR